MLEISLSASQQVGQQYLIVTLDLEVAKKVFSIEWQQSEFRNVIVRLGVFHAICLNCGLSGVK